MIANYDSLMFIHNTPVEDGITQAWTGLMVNVGREVTDEDRARATIYQNASRAAFAQDFDVWANKAPCKQVLQLPTDGPYIHGIADQPHPPRRQAAGRSLPGTFGFARAKRPRQVDHDCRNENVDQRGRGAPACPGEDAPMVGGEQGQVGERAEEGVPLGKRGVLLGKPHALRGRAAGVRRQRRESFDQRFGVRVLEIEELGHPVRDVDRDRRFILREALLFPPGRPRGPVLVFRDAGGKLHRHAEGLAGKARGLAKAFPFPFPTLSVPLRGWVPPDARNA